MKSAILVAYKTAGFIEENIKKLKKMGFEIIIAADEPDEELSRIIREYKPKVSISKKRRGKWKALNDAVDLATGQYLFFIDSDTKIECDLSNAEKLFEECDAIEIRKEVNASSTIEKLVNIDYLNMYVVAVLASRLGTSLGLNGAASGIKRDVLLKLGGFRRKINEDTDLGIRLGVKGYRVGVWGKAITKAPSSLKEWLTQRERWAVGGSDVFIENFSSIIRKPTLWLPALILLFPAIIGLALNMALPDNILFKAMYLISLIPSIPSNVLATLLFILYQGHILKNFIAVFLSFLIWAFSMVLISKKTEWRIDYKLLPVYYFIYSPFWMMLCLIALVRVTIARLIGKEIKVRNWIT